MPSSIACIHTFTFTLSCPDSENKKLKRFDISERHGQRSDAGGGWNELNGTTDGVYVSGIGYTDQFWNEWGSNKPNYRHAWRRRYLVILNVFPQAKVVFVFPRANGRLLEA